MHHGRRIAAIAVARAASTRLPGKMALPFNGTTVMENALDAAAACTLVDTVIFATSTNPQDNTLAALAAKRGLQVVRGSEEDVTSRLRLALDEVQGGADCLVRVCCDNPLMDPALVDSALRDLIDHGADIVTPGEYATLPFGSSQVVMTADCLRRIDDGARLSLHREHVENYCFDTPHQFKVRYQKAPAEIHMPELLLTLDHAEDYRRLERMQRLLRDVPIAGRISHLVRRLQTARIGVAAADEAFARFLAARVAALMPDATVTTCPRDDDAPDLLLAVADADVGRCRLSHAPRAGCVSPTALGNGRWGLKYGPGSPDGFPHEPLMLQAVTAADAPEALRLLLPFALPHLMGAPLRKALPNAYMEGLQSAPEKSSGTRRAGFAQPWHAQNPPRLVVEAGPGVAEALDSVIAELREDGWADRCSIILGGDAQAADEIGELLRAALPSLRLEQSALTGTPADPFREMVLGVDGLARCLRDDSARRSVIGPWMGWPLRALWRGKSLRRARVDLLNGERNG